MKLSEILSNIGIYVQDGAEKLRPTWVKSGDIIEDVLSNCIAKVENATSFNTIDGFDINSKEFKCLTAQHYRKVDN